MVLLHKGYASQPCSEWGRGWEQRLIKTMGGRVGGGEGRERNVCRRQREKQVEMHLCLFVSLDNIVTPSYMHCGCSGGRH